MNRFTFNVHKHRIIKFLLSISFLSALFTIFPLLLQSLKPFMAMRLIEKSYMFLLCNGLVVFILKSSGLVDVRKGFEIENDDPPEEATEEIEDQQERMVSSDEDKEDEETEPGIDRAIVAIGEEEDKHHDEEDEAEDADELNQKVE
ncbi:uncharacterized protein LOC129317101 [Prosopis cineraria]|uniref:uncharacterized protein LOC129317101 n=1 Tax=Prosopis cineraria TaxID=364024 RepID=UPI00240FD9D2|nr:uncharacterized protein LOC129317101 [Prosopis cineraria]